MEEAPHWRLATETDFNQFASADWMVIDRLLDNNEVYDAPGALVNYKHLTLDDGMWKLTGNGMSGHWKYAYYRHRN